MNDRAGLPKQRWWTISNLTKVTRNYSGTRITCRLFVNLAMTERLPRKAAGEKKGRFTLTNLGGRGALISTAFGPRSGGPSREISRNSGRGVKGLKALFYKVFAV